MPRGKLDWGTITPKYKKGDRVHPSERFHKQFRQSRLRDVGGTVVGFGHMPNVYRVKWDTRNSVDSLHDCFLLGDQIEEPANAGDEVSQHKKALPDTPSLKEQGEQGDG